MTVPAWLFIVLVFFVILAPLLGAALGAWIILKIKHPGVSLVSTEAKENDTNSYLHPDLLEDYGEANILTEEPMSEAAMRIRKQKISGDPMEDTITEVEGLA